MNKGFRFFLTLIALILAMPICSAQKKQSIGKNNKVLVAYYSQTGNTEKVAEAIAKELNATLFAIKPKIPYKNEDLDWADQNSRVCIEHNKGFDNVNVELESTTIKDFDSYDIVFIGYPIWWREASWVIDSFVKNNDFSGKNIFCFCTSISSGTGESMKRLETLSKAGNWIEGKRFPSNFNAKDVKSWLKGLKY